MHEDPFEQMRALQRKFESRGKTLVLGVSHNHPAWLKRLQFAFQTNNLHLIGSNDFELLLVSDYDFGLFKTLHFSPNHVIWIKPRFDHLT